MTVKQELNALKKLKEEDLIALQNIYLYRTLTVSQLMDSVYHLKSNQGRKKAAILKRLMDLNVITLAEYKANEHAVMLTNLGISIVRQTKNIPNEIYDDDLKTVKKGYYTAKELGMQTRLLNHQLTKNQFMLKFKELFKAEKMQTLAQKYGIKLKYTYFDEKYLTNYLSMRPDSVLHIGNTDFFIEEDMATESKKQLEDKWRDYRRFMQTKEFYLKENKIVVLFLTDNIVKEKTLKRRISMVKQTALNIIGDTFTNGFDMYIDSQENILKMMPELILESYGINSQLLLVFHELRKAGWKISSAESIKDVFNNEDFYAYLRKTTKDNRIIIDSFRPQEFVADSYYLPHLSVIHRINYFDLTGKKFDDQYHRQLQYLIFTTDNPPAELKAITDPNIFLTTGKRFVNLPLNEALFRYDKNRKYHFTDNELTSYVFESETRKEL